MKAAGLVGVILILVLAGIAWGVIQWLECRSMDFSVLYCIAHIS